MATKTSIPVSLFGNVRENTAETIEVENFEQIVEFFEEEAHREYERKEDAPLLASCRFQNGLRRKANVEDSGMVMLDIDDGTTIEDVDELFKGLGAAFVLYSTASHREEHHKFRVGIPLGHTTDAETYTRVWWSLNWLLEDTVDASKRGAESLFYLPGTYGGRPYRFVASFGEILDPKDWIEEINRPDLEGRMGRKLTSRSSKKPPASKPGLGRCADPRDIRLADTPLVTERALSNYLDEARAGSPNWHHARYRFMCAVAGRAVKLHIGLSPSDLRHLFNQVDDLDGGYYTSDEDQAALLADAERALCYVTETRNA